MKFADGHDKPIQYERVIVHFSNKCTFEADTIETAYIGMTTLIEHCEIEMIPTYVELTDNNDCCVGTMKIVTMHTFEFNDVRGPQQTTTTGKKEV